MQDREQQQRERAYKIWEDEGRIEGAQDDHWHRAEQPHEMSSQESEEVTKVNQQADDEFAHEDTGQPPAADTRPPSTASAD